MPKQRPFAKGQNVCIFCKSPGLTCEHIFPDWLEEYIPREIENTESLTTVFHADHIETKRQSRPGDPHSRRLRVVCGGCNSGWMSILQKSTKPILVPLILGEASEINAEAQKKLATWATMATMVADYLDRDRSAIPEEQRTTFKENQAPLREWKIWVGHHEREEWRGHLVRSIFPIATEKHVPEVMANGLHQPNTQTTAFTVGKLYFLIVSSEIPELAERFRLGGAAANKVAQIWPNVTDTIAWPPATLTDAEASGLADAFFNSVLRLMKLQHG